MKIKDKEYIINRDNAKVTEWDKQYCNLLKEVIEHGELAENRTGIETLQIPNAYIKLDVGKSFPILETKKVNMKNSITELLWIYQAQTNKVDWLHERDNHIWDEWVIDNDGIYRIYDPFIKENLNRKVRLKNPNGTDFILPDEMPIDIEGKLENKTIKNAIYYGPEYAGTIGDAYGSVLKKTREFDNVLRDLKNNPRSRRMVVSLRQAKYLKNGVLEPCVWTSTFNVMRNKLHCNVNVRSNDMPLGNPFNVTQYAVLLAILAKTNNFDMGELAFNISNCHIYINQLKGIKLELERFDRLTKWEKFIQTKSDEEVEREYKELISRKELLDKKISDMPFLANDYEEIKREVEEEIMCFEHLITRENPEIYIAPNKDFYCLDNKKENEDIKILKYTSLPFIKMPVAQ